MLIKSIIKRRQCLIGTRKYNYKNTYGYKNYDNYKICEDFKKSNNKQLFWDTLSCADKKIFKIYHCLEDITISGSDFNEIYHDFNFICINLDSSIYKVGSLVENLDDSKILQQSKNLQESKSLQGIKFIPNKGIMPNNDQDIFYVDIPNNAKITISEISLQIWGPYYFSDKLIIKKIIPRNHHYELKNYMGIKKSCLFSERTN